MLCNAQAQPYVFKVLLSCYCCFLRKNLRCVNAFLWRWVYCTISVAKKFLSVFLRLGAFYTTLTKCKGKGKLGKKKVTKEHSFVTYGSCAKILRIPCHFFQLTEKRYIRLRYVSRSTHKTLWNHKPKEKQREWALTKESFHLQIFFFVFFAIAPLTADANKRKKRQKREESGGETNERTRKIPQGRKLYKFIKLIGIAFEG